MTVLPSDLTQDLLDDFYENIKSGLKEDGSKYSVQTNRRFISAARALVSELQKADIAHQDTVVRKILGKHIAKNSVLSDETFQHFIQMVRSDVIAIMREVSTQWASCKIGQDQKSMALRSAMDSYDVLPERQWLKAYDKTLFLQIEKVGYGAIRKTMHPSVVDLTPFVYYLAVVSHFNQQPLLEIGLSDLATLTILGQRRFVMRPPKARANGARQNRSFAITDETDNPSNVVDFLRKWTERIRVHAPGEAKEKLFIFVPRNRGADASVKPVFHASRRIATDFANSSTTYCKKRGFKRIGLKTLRATGAQLAYRVFNGDVVAVETLLGHANPKLSTPAYRSEEATKRDALRLAGAMTARERWLASSGAADGRTESKGRSRSAATPGFRCIDPYDSPIPGQFSGRLCAAYGLCPTCPLGQPSEDAAYAVARMLQLREKAISAKNRVGITVWKERHAPIINAIDEVWLPLLAKPAVMKEAKRLHLNELPEIE